MTRLRAAFAIAVLLAPLSAAADVRISEISYDPQGSDSKREWIEIFNAGPDTVDLSKIKFTDASNHVLNAPPKNGSTGSMSLASNSYAVLAADATTFRSLYPGTAEVIDTAMSLKNDGGTLSLTGASGALDSVQYTSALGASGDGDSLQLSNGSWIHAAPTPGAANATQPSVHHAAAAKHVTKTVKAPVAKTASAKIVKETVRQNDANDPMPLVNAVPQESNVSQVAAAGSLGGYAWWLAAAAFAIIVGAAASVISKQKKGEWDIVEES